MPAKFKSSLEKVLFYNSRNPAYEVTGPVGSFNGDLVGGGKGVDADYREREIALLLMCVRSIDRSDIVAVLEGNCADPEALADHWLGEPIEPEGGVI